MQLKTIDISQVENFRIFGHWLLYALFVANTITFFISGFFFLILTLFLTSYFTGLRIYNYYKTHLWCFYTYVSYAFLLCFLNFQCFCITQNFFMLGLGCKILYIGAF
ncbi:hypothetical protein C2G38_199814 [Gigaspora rosea]|uniref:Uncharacterized protein n=1 Tax=Gigaspora rosea TaxID=44941 RepID=A0A397UJ44_9GLOM|nr:hypothetical protein C2G38_199814 [Gigaspora rosea]